MIKKSTLSSKFIYENYLITLIIKIYKNYKIYYFLKSKLIQKKLRISINKNQI